MGFIFMPSLIPLVMDGTKTQTRRPVKPGDCSRDMECTAIYRNNRNLWEIGRQYAIVPGRGKHGVGFLKITNITPHDVRFISRDDAIAEGFADEMGFLQVWTQLYDPVVELSRVGTYAPASTWWMQYKPHGKRGSSYQGGTTLENTVETLRVFRPSELYAAYAVTFEIVKE